MSNTEIQTSRDKLKKDLESILSNRPPQDGKSKVHIPSTPDGKSNPKKGDTTVEKVDVGRKSDSDLPEKKLGTGEKERSKSFFGKVPSMISFGAKKETLAVPKTLSSILSPRFFEAKVETKPDHGPHTLHHSLSVGNFSPPMVQFSPPVSPRDSPLRPPPEEWERNLSPRDHKPIVVKKDNHGQRLSERTDLTKGLVLHTFVGRQEDEATVQEGDVIYIISEREDGWSVVVFGGDKEGLMPTNHYRRLSWAVVSSHREKVLQEFIQTEITYVENLKRLVSAYMTPLELVLSPQLILGMFGNVKVVIGVNQLFMDKLDELLRSRCTVDEREEKLATILLNLSVTFKLYVSYIAEFENSQKLIREELKKNQKMADCLKACNQKLRDDGCNIFDIHSYMILPIQRLPRYRMLIEDLIKHIPEEHTENLRKIKQARDAVCNIVAYCNEKQREIDNQKLLFKIQQKFELPFRPSQEVYFMENKKIKVVGLGSNDLSSEFYVLDNCIAWIEDEKKYTIYQHDVDTIVDVPTILQSGSDKGFVVKLKDNKEVNIWANESVAKSLSESLVKWKGK